MEGFLFLCLPPQINLNTVSVFIVLGFQFGICNDLAIFFSCNVFHLLLFQHLVSNNYGYFFFAFHMVIFSLFFFNATHQVDVMCLLH